MFKCECGKEFKTSQGLRGHKFFAHQQAGQALAKRSGKIKAEPRLGWLERLGFLQKIRRRLAERDAELVAQLTAELKAERDAEYAELRAELNAGCAELKAELNAELARIKAGAAEEMRKRAWEEWQRFLSSKEADLRAAKVLKELSLL